MTAAFRFRRLRFSLRTFMVVVSAFCVVLGMGGARVYHQRSVLHEVSNRGGHWHYDDFAYYSLPSPTVAIVRNSAGRSIAKVTYPPAKERSWFRKLVGDDWFAEVVSVGFAGRSFGNAELQAVVPHLAKLPKLSNIQLQETSVTHEGIAVLSQLKGLRRLNLNSTPVRIDDPGTLELRSKMPNLGISY